MAKYTYKINTVGPKKSLLVYKDGDKIYESDPGFTVTNELLRREAISNLEDSDPGVKDMVEVTPPTETGTETNTTTINTNTTVDISSTEGPTSTIIKNDTTIDPEDVDGGDPYADFWGGYESDPKTGTYINKNDKRRAIQEQTNTNSGNYHSNDIYGGFWTDRKGREAKVITPSFTPNSSSVNNTSNFIPTGNVSSLSDLSYINMPIDNAKYYDGTFNKTKLILHWTAGWGKVANVKYFWEHYWKKMRVIKTREIINKKYKYTRENTNGVSTSWLISNKTVNGSKIDLNHDAKLYKFYDDKNHWSHHSSAQSAIHQTSIAMEICNIGWLDKIGGKYKYYGNNSFNHPESEVYDNGSNFRGHRYFQRISNEQLNVLRDWIIVMANEYNIQIQRKGSFDKSFFLNPQPQAKNVNQHGIFLHTHYKTKGKWDLPPQPELMDMLNSL